MSPDICRVAPVSMITVEDVETGDVETGSGEGGGSGGHGGTDGCGGGSGGDVVRVEEEDVEAFTG